MKKATEPAGSFEFQQSSYPGALTPEYEEPEEENPTAYTLLSKIEDPYYAPKQPNGEAARKDSYRQENQSNLPIYKSFYSVTPTRAGSSGIFSTDLAQRYCRFFAFSSRSRKCDRATSSTISF